MTPSSPDTPVVKGETLEEIAERIAKRVTDNPCSHPFCCPRTAGVEADILSALRNERERALRIIKKHRESDVCEDNCWTAISQTIREGK